MSESDETCRVLFVDDEESVRYFARRGLERRGFAVTTADSGTAGLAELEKASFDVVVTDLRMPGIDGFEFLQRIRRQRSDLPVVVITAHGSVDNAVQAMREGASDFLAKPFEIDELALLIGRVREGGASRSSAQVDSILGESESARAMRDAIVAWKDSDEAVVFYGESGVGKTHCARALHGSSQRGTEPFQRLELAGQELSQRRSEVRRALARSEGGTLYLAGLEDLDDEAAEALCDELGRASCRILGGLEGAVTDLPRALSSVFPRSIGVDPLRVRREDLRALTEEFLRQSAVELGAVCREFSPEVLAGLQQLSWPGNLRELRNMVQRAVVLHRDVEVLELSHLGEFEAMQREEAVSGYHEALHAFELEFFSSLFRSTRGNVSEAARRAGLSRGHLHRKVKQLGLDPARFR
ncbi:MAG: response regulator [Planctomycetota bacterium]